MKVLIILLNSVSNNNYKANTSFGLTNNEYKFNSFITEKKFNLFDYEKKFFSELRQLKLT